MNTERDVVRVYSGPVVQVELYQQVLTDAGITSNVVGLHLAAGVGTALQNSVELWVKSEDAERAATAIRRADEKRTGG